MLLPLLMTTSARLRTLLFALLLGTLGALTLSGVAVADLITPEDGGSPNADSVDDLYKLTLALAIVVFIGVEGAIFYSVIRFRARKGAVPAQIRGNTRLEIGFTVASALVLVVLATVTFAQLGEIRNAPESGPNGLQFAANVDVNREIAGASGSGASPSDTSIQQGQGDAAPDDGKSLLIRVNGQQYLWRYIYPDGDRNRLNNPFDYEELVVPTDTTVTLEITAQDVNHSWWIPELGGKFDAVPAYKNYTWFKIPGRFAGRTFAEGKRFRGQCAELCGRNHANMIAHVRAVTPQQYEEYIARKQREIAQANSEGARQREGFEREAEQTDTEDATQPETP
jgi:cytochrome c oxidase subunit 2